MYRVIHFEIPSNSPQEAMTFYENVFGWRFNKWGNDEYWITETGPTEYPGINGAILKKDSFRSTLLNKIEVDDIPLEVVCQTIAENGGEIVLPKTAIPGVGWHIIFRDLDGNLMGVIQNDPSAK